MLSRLQSASGESRTRRTSACRVALLIPLQGAAGIWAPSCIASAKTAVAELNKNNGIGGRQVELTYVDAASEVVEDTTAQVSQLIDDNQIDAIVGTHLSNVRQETAKVLNERIPFVYTPFYEGGERTPGVFAIGESPHKQLGPGLQHLTERYRLRKWALIGNDYSWPRTSHIYAKTHLARLNVDLSFEEYVPFDSDMYEVARRIGASGADGVLISLIGQDAINFNRAFGDLGLHRQAIRFSCAVEENGLLACGAENLERLYSAASYYGALSTEENARFREKYHSIHGGQAPMLNTVGQSTYEGLHFLSELLGDGRQNWRDANPVKKPIRYKSARKSTYLSNSNNTAPIYLARADGLSFSDFRPVSQS